MKFTPEELESLKSRFAGCNNQTVLRLIDHIEEVEKELEECRSGGVPKWKPSSVNVGGQETSQ